MKIFSQVNHYQLNKIDPIYYLPMAFGGAFIAGCCLIAAFSRGQANDRPSICSRTISFLCLGIVAACALFWATHSLLQNADVFAQEPHYPKSF